MSSAAATRHPLLERFPARPLAVASIMTVLLVDVVLFGAATQVPRPVFGVLDQLAHVATTSLFLLALAVSTCRRGGRAPVARALWAAVLATVLIDLDHAPLELFGSEVLTAGTPRPYSHSLATVAVLLLVAAVAPRRWRVVIAASAGGVVLHLWRDLATAPVSLLWPASTLGLTVPYGVYLATLLMACGCVLLGPPTAVGRPAGDDNAQPSRSSA